MRKDWHAPSDSPKNDRRDSMLCEMKREPSINPQYARGRSSALAYTIIWAVIILLFQTLLFLQYLLPGINANFPPEAIFRIFLEGILYLVVIGVVVFGVYSILILNNTKIPALLMIGSGSFHLSVMLVYLSFGPGTLLFLLLIVLGFLMLSQESIKQHRVRTNEILEKYEIDTGKDRLKH
ncbi:MAG: hypothetical protein FWG78_01980 [Coriobacteriia bacterium]|nr:hypothetical protein [Coriobacteriia bacterium]